MPSLPNVQNAVRAAIYNTCRPPEGSLFVPLVIPFDATNQSWVVDCGQLQKIAQISYFQSIYIDNSLNTVQLAAQVGGSNQIIRVPAGWEGIVLILAPEPTTITFTSLVAGSTPILVHLLNFPVNTFLWPTNPLGSSITPLFVTDPTLDALLAGGSLPVLERVTGSNSVSYLRPIADTNQFTLATAVGATVFLAAVANQRYYIEQVTFNQSGNATAAALGAQRATLYEGGGGVTATSAIAMFTTIVPIAAIAAAAPSQSFVVPVRKFTPVNTAINIDLLVAYTAGSMQVQADYALGAF